MILSYSSFHVSLTSRAINAMAHCSSLPVVWLKCVPQELHEVATKFSFTHSCYQVQLEHLAGWHVSVCLDLRHTQSWVFFREWWYSDLRAVCVWRFPSRHACQRRIQTWVVILDWSILELELPCFFDEVLSHDRRDVFDSFADDAVCDSRIIVCLWRCEHPDP